MQLVMEGQNNPASLQHVNPAEMRRRTRHSAQGYFLDNGQYYLTSDGSSLTISFNPQILILEGLDSAAEARIVTEEAQHETDFHGIVRRMERALRAAIRAGQDPSIDDYWAWFRYYVEDAAARYHQHTENMRGETLDAAGLDTTRPTEPSSPRPF